MVARRTLTLVVCALAAAWACATASAQPAAVANPVPSLTPARTQALWEQLVRRPRPPQLRAFGACSPLRAVFYAGTDWLRLATKLAATPSPCAQYFVSIPPLAADKTRFRSDQPWRIRALGPQFHALAEINITGWTRYVDETGSSWFAAGAEARRRMTASGFDVTAGDGWALNELTSAVRQGTGQARGNMRAFLNGLYDGEGARPVKGAVFITGIGQNTGDVSVYQARVQDWYEDEPFWTDISRTVSDWSQELYGDVRTYAVAGQPPLARAAALNEYLLHQPTLANVAPATAGAARAFLAATYNPLANAAWIYDASFGFTNVPVDVMQDYVSGQTYALRAAGLPRFGFAWAPRNLTGIPDFAAQTDALLARLAAAIRDSAGAPESACAGGWCTRSVAGAAFTPKWRSFATWSPSLLAFTTPPPTLVAGTPVPLAVELRTSTGIPYTTGLPLAVTLTSSSATGAFSTSPTGPFAPTLTVTMASGASTATVYFTDTTPGAPTISANAPGRTGGTLAAVVTAPPGGTAPETTITAAPTGVVRTSAVSIAFVSNVGGVGFECSLDGAAFAPCTSPASYADLVDGAHVFDVRAVDASRNSDLTPAHAEWTIDTTPPDTTITEAPALATASTRAKFRFRTEAGARLECSLDGRVYALCTSPTTYANLRPGKHTFRLRATDAAGNRAPPARRIWTVDRTPPTTTVVRGPKSGTSARRATLYFRSSEPRSTFRCSLDGRSFALCKSPYRRAALGRGTHTFRVRAVDAAGNADRTPARYTWSIS